MTNTTADRIATTSTADLDLMKSVIVTATPTGFYTPGTVADDVLTDLGFTLDGKGRSACMEAVRLEIARRKPAPVAMRLENRGKGRDFEKNNKMLRSAGGVFDARSKTWTVPDGEAFSGPCRESMGLRVAYTPDLTERMDRADSDL